MAVRVGMLKSGMTAEDHRLSSQVHALGTGQALQTRSGLVPGSNPTYTKVAGMTARVSAFQAWIDGTSQFVQGGYPFTNDADADVTFADGDATRDRIDLVVARVYDQLYDASGNQLGRIEVVKGDYPVSGQPVAPATPASSIVLWEQPIPAGATAGSGGINVANATRRWVYTAAAGGIVPVRNQAERDALAAYDGLWVGRLDTGNLERRHQGQWGPPSDIAALTGDIASGAWQPVAMQNEWTTGSGSFQASARKQAGGMGYLRGQFTPKTSANAVGTVIGVLPAGLGPAVSVIVDVPTSTGGTAQVQVVGNRNVQLQQPHNSTAHLYFAMAYPL